MVSSSSESQKLVVSSSLLITVLELSYPARWRSSRLWPFIRGPGTTAEEAPGKTRGKIFALEFSCLLKSAAKTFLTSRHSLIISRPFHCLDVGQVPHLDGTVIKIFLKKREVICFFSPCCSMLSLCRGLSLLKETTDSVSVWSSKVSTLPVALGL